MKPVRAAVTAWVVGCAYVGSIRKATSRFCSEHPVRGGRDMLARAVWCGVYLSYVGPQLAMSWIREVLQSFKTTER